LESCPLVRFGDRSSRLEVRRALRQQGICVEYAVGFEPALNDHLDAGLKHVGYRAFVDDRQRSAGIRRFEVGDELARISLNRSGIHNAADANWPLHSAGAAGFEFWNGEVIDGRCLSDRKREVGESGQQYKSSDEEPPLPAYAFLRRGRTSYQIATLPSRRSMLPPCKYTFGGPEELRSRARSRASSLVDLGWLS
jgi:hypothetical protein